MDQQRRRRFRADVALFLVQILLIVVVVSVSILNLSLGCDNPNFWTVLLTSCLGYIMPNPKIKITDGVLSVRGSQTLTDVTNGTPNS